MSKSCKLCGNPVGLLNSLCDDCKLHTFDPGSDASSPDITDQPQNTYIPYQDADIAATQIKPVNQKKKPASGTLATVVIVLIVLSFMFAPELINRVKSSSGGSTIKSDFPVSPEAEAVTPTVRLSQSDKNKISVIVDKQFKAMVSSDLDLYLSAFPKGAIDFYVSKSGYTKDQVKEQALLYLFELDSESVVPKTIIKIKECITAEQSTLDFSQERLKQDFGIECSAVVEVTADLTFVFDSQSSEPIEFYITLIKVGDEWCLDPRLLEIYEKSDS